MSRSWLEENNWLQGSFISSKDIELLRTEFAVIPEGDIYLVTASQSCDACADVEKEEFIEFSVARPIDEVKGNCEHNKNPRCLHLTTDDNGSNEEFSSVNLEFLAHEKIRLKKTDIEAIKRIKPCEDITLRDTTVTQYSNWLAARYNRPALPSAFERRFNEKWGKSQRKKINKVSGNILGIYVDIQPNEEIPDNDPYFIDLLFLITTQANEDPNLYEDIVNLSTLYRGIMTDVGFKVGDIDIATKSDVSLAFLESYKRLILDSLSYKNDEPLPPNLGQ